MMISAPLKLRIAWLLPKSRTPKSMVELDYGGLADYLELALAEEGGLEADNSIEDIQSSIAGLAVGDGALAGRGYENLVTRWRKVAAFESAS